MKNNTLIWVSLVLALLLVGLFWADRKGLFGNPLEVVRTDTVFSIRTDTMWRDTTIIKLKPVVKKKEAVRVDTVFTQKGDTLELLTEKKTYQERLISGMDTCDLDICVTGINTSLDSLKMRLKTHTDVVTNTIEITKYVKRKKRFTDRFHIGLQVGYGYTFNSKELQPYVGIGASFDL